MSVSRNALGNLVNRYRSVLKKCCAKNAAALLLAASLCLPSSAAANSGGSVVPDMPFRGTYTYIGAPTPGNTVVINSENDDYNGTFVTIFTVYGGYVTNGDVQHRNVIFGGGSSNHKY